MGMQQSGRCDRRGSGSLSMLLCKSGLVIDNTKMKLPLSLSSTSAKINSSAPAAADIQHPLKGVQDGDSELGHSVLWENWQDRSSDS